VALCDALEAGRVRPGALLLMPSFGGGLSFCAHVVRWGSRTSALHTSAVELPPNDRPALEILRACLARKTRAIATAATTPFGDG
jgi:3-oxoacyl-[acyl-carrier-protein] synthase-3